jgi:hypothetical protein
MSKERQRSRRAREQAQRQARRESQGGRQGGRAVPPVDAKRPAAGRGRKERPPVYRQRRYPPLPMRLKVLLAVLWLAVQVAAFLLLPNWGQRLAVLIVSTFALPLIVVIVRDPARRTKR